IDLVGETIKLLRDLAILAAGPGTMPYQFFQGSIHAISALYGLTEAPSSVVGVPLTSSAREDCRLVRSSESPPAHRPKESLRVPWRRGPAFGSCLAAQTRAGGGIARLRARETCSPLEVDDSRWLL